MTKKQLQKTCKTILNKYSLGQFLTRSEAIFMGAIFKNHPNWEQKRKMKIRGVKVDKDQFGHRCFWLVFVDGSQTSISYITSIKAKCDSHRQLLIKACRMAIIDEIFEVKKTVNYGVDKCKFTGEVLTNENTHIDHYDLKFNQMFKLWEKQININDVEVIKSGQKYFIKDKKIESDFVDFHNANCKLRAVSKDFNLKRR